MVDIKYPKGNIEVMTLVGKQSANKVQEIIISLLFLVLRFLKRRQNFSLRHSFWGFQEVSRVCFIFKNLVVQSLNPEDEDMFSAQIMERNAH